MDNNTFQIGGLVLIFVRMVYQDWQADRRRREDKLELMEKTEAEAAVLAAKAEHDNIALRTKTDRIELKLDHNTQLTRVGNGIKEDIVQNQKSIAETQEALLAMQTRNDQAEA